MLVVLETVLMLASMNILIEDADSLKFFIGEGLWSKTATEGKRFAGTALAFKAAKQESVGKFNVVGYIAETKQLINLDHGRGKGLAEIPAVTRATPITPAAV
jgi:hypothetical protein